MFSPGSAETNVEWGGKLNSCMMANCVRNICIKNHKNLVTGFLSYSRKCRGCFWRTVYFLLLINTHVFYNISYVFGNLLATQTHKLRSFFCASNSQGKLGEILLSLCYQPTAEILSVVVIEARQLKSKDINGLSGTLHVIVWQEIFYIVNNLIYTLRTLTADTTIISLLILLVFY